MTRKEAKELANISRETLEKIAPNVAKHYEVFIAYAKGETIEWYCMRDKKWEVPNEVFFCVNEKYRVKKAVPKGDHFADVSNKVGCGIDLNALADKMIALERENKDLKIRNENLHKAKEALIAKKTEILVQVVDGKPLSTAEEVLIRFFRKDKGKYLNLLTDAALNLIRVLHEHNICEVLGEASQALVYVDDDGDVNFKKDVVALEFMNADAQEAVAKAFVNFMKEKEQEA